MTQPFSQHKWFLAIISLFWGTRGLHQEGEGSQDRSYPRAALPKELAGGHVAQETVWFFLAPSLVGFSPHVSAVLCYCIPKAIMMGTGEIRNEKVHASPRPPPKISFKRQLDERFGFRSCWTTRRSWKGESELSIKILFGNDSWNGSKIHHNTELWIQLMVSRWNSSGIFPRIHHIAVRRQSPRVQKHDPAQIQGRIIFMSIFDDIIWRTTDNLKECIANATLVSLFAKRFPAGRWSFLGPGSEKKWYSTLECKPRGEWDRVAELMMIKFGESGHPVFRATSPLSRETLKSVPKEIRLKLFFAQSFLLISLSTAQSQICVKHTVLVKQEWGDPCWQDNLTHCSSQQNY